MAIRFGCAVLLLLAMRLSAAAQVTPPATQNPSPMTEETRAHERLAQSVLPGTRRTIAGPTGGTVDVYVPALDHARDAVDLVVHFHGEAWLPHQAVAFLGDHAASAVVNLGSGSGVYHRAFTESWAFDSLLSRINVAVASATGRRVHIGRLTLAGFSAGHGAIRQVLREPRHFAVIDAVLLLDGMHTSYVPDGKVLAGGGQLDTTNLVAFAAFASAAARGEKRFLITHSEIFPGTFASTTDTTVTADAPTVTTRTASRRREASHRPTPSTT